MGRYWQTYDAIFASRQWQRKRFLANYLLYSRTFYAITPYFLLLTPYFLLITLYLTATTTIASYL